ncbi:MAG: DUF1592 domain-containing protein, partial [Myxococcota bacterium]
MIVSPSTRQHVGAQLCALLIAATGCLGSIGDAADDLAAVDDLGADSSRAGLVCEPGSLFPSPAPIKRMTRVELDNTLRDLLGSRERHATAVPEDDYGGGYNVGSTISQLHIETYLAVAEAAATEAMGRITTLWACADYSQACARAFAERFGKRAYRRPLEQSEVDVLASFFAAQQSAYGGPEAQRLLIARMLTSPSFLYRAETGDAGLAAFGGPADGVPLDRYELASRLAYLIWASMPDDELIAAAERGELSTTEGIERQARRLLGDPKARGGLRNFYAQWLELDRGAELEKDAALFPRVDDTLRAAMNGETRAFMDHVLWDDDATLTTALTASYGFVDASLARLYGVESAYQAASALQPTGATSLDIGAAMGETVVAEPALTLASDGLDIWGTSDAFRYAHFSIDGDGGIVARVSAMSGGSEWAKAGVMLRDGTAPGARNAALHLTKAHGIVFNRRLLDGGATVSTAVRTASAPVWLAIERRGDVVIASTSDDGVAFVEAGRAHMVLPSSVHVGLAVARGNAPEAVRATFDGVRQHGLVKVDLDPSQRAGFLTQAGVLARLSRPYETSPIFRGMFVLDRLLCTHLAPPPDLDVDLPAIDPTKTTRERTSELTEKGTCAACHTVINPLGFTFESYDAAGAFRDTENGKPIDASGALQTSRGRTAVVGVVGEGGLLSALVDDISLHECVATQWLRYAFGRNNVEADDCSLAEVDRRFAVSGYDLT